MNNIDDVVEPPLPVATAVDPFQCPQCERAFKNAAALRMHKIRKHSNRGWSTAQNFRVKKYRYPSDSPEYRKRKYEEAKARERRRKAREYQKAHYHRKKAERLAHQQNGVAAPELAQTDIVGEAAKAILVAAKVLRGTITSLKLP